MIDVRWIRPGERAEPAILSRLRAAARPLYLAAGLPLLRQTLRALAAEPSPAGRRVEAYVFARYLERTFTAACREWRPIEDLEQRLLLRRLLADLPLPALRPIVGRPGLLAAAQRVIRELKETGVPPERWRERLTAPREADFAALAVAYQAALAAQRLADREDVFRLAAAHLAAHGPAQPHDLVVVQGFATLTGLERQAIAALAQHTAVLLLVTFDPGRAHLFAPTLDDLGEWWVTARPLAAGPAPAGAAPPELTHLQAELFRRPQPASAPPGGAVRFIVAPDPEREVREVARTVKELILAGQAPEEIALVAPEPAAYRELVRETFTRYGIPVQLPPEPLIAAPVVQAVLGLLRLVAARWRQAELLSLVGSPYLGCPPAVAAWLERVGAALPPLSGPEMWLAALKSYRGPGPGQAARPSATGEAADGGAAAAEAVRTAAAAFLTDLAGSLAPLQSAATLAEHCRALARALEQLQVEQRILALAGGQPLDGETAALAARELSAYRALLRVLVRLAATAGADAGDPAGARPETLDTALFAAVLTEELAGVGIPAPRPPRGAAVRFLVPAQTEGLRLPVVFLLGLSEGVFPARRPDDWVFPEERRRALGLATWERHQAAERLQLLRVVRAAVRRLCLTRSATDRDGAARLPSPFWEEAVACFDGSLPTHRVPPSSLAPAACAEAACPEEMAQRLVQVGWGAAPASPTEQALAVALHGAGLPGLGADQWLDLVARIDAEAARRSGQYTAWDGRLSAPAVLAALAERYGSGHRFSASELEVYACCPFRFLGERLLGLAEAEEYEPDLSPQEQGAGLHRILAEFGRRWGRRPLTGDADALLQSVVVEQAARQLGRLAPALRAARTRQWQRQAAAWLDAERQAQARTGGHLLPTYLEWSFGLPPRPGQDPRSTAEPLRLDAGDCLLTGVVDRIDTDGEGNFVVFDYKAGRAPSAADILVRRLRLQLPVYLLAAARLGLPGATRPLGGAYYSLRDLKRSGGLWREEARGVAGLTRGGLADADFDAALAELEAHLGNLVAALRQGNLTVNPRAACPAYCSMRTACRFDEARLAGKAGRAGEGEGA